MVMKRKNAAYGHQYENKTPRPPFDGMLLLHARRRPGCLRKRRLGMTRGLQHNFGTSH